MALPRHRQGHQRHIGRAVLPGQGREGLRDGGHPGRIGLNAAQKFRPFGQHRQSTTLIKLHRATLALAHHLGGQQTVAIEIHPEGEGPTPSRGIKGSPLTCIQQRHPHLHQ